MCSLHLFSVFMLAVANTIERVQGVTTIQEAQVPPDALALTQTEVDAYKNFNIKLSNSILTDLGKSLARIGLCSREESHLIVISTLSLKNKLPKVDVMLR